MTRRALRNWSWATIGVGVAMVSIGSLAGFGAMVFVIGLFALLMSFAVSSFEGDNHEDIHITQTLYYRGITRMMRKVSHFLIVASVFEGFLVNSGTITTVLLLVGFAGLILSGLMNFVAHPVFDKNDRRIP